MDLWPWCSHDISFMPKGGAAVRIKMSGAHHLLTVSLASVLDASAGCTKKHTNHQRHEFKSVYFCERPLGCRSDWLVEVSLRRSETESKRVCKDFGRFGI
eukprot:4761451-Amphidinium_carterae.1